MELQSVIASYKKDGTVEIWTSTQSPFSTRYLMALSLGMPVDKIVVKAPLCGGGFGERSESAGNHLFHFFQKEQATGPSNSCCPGKNSSPQHRLEKDSTPQLKRDSRKMERCSLTRLGLLWTQAATQTTLSMCVEPPDTHPKDATKYKHLL